MAMVSPTPLANGLVRRTSQRQALRRLPSRPTVARGDSQSILGASSSNQAPMASHDQSQKYHDESSEDEIPVPMKLSALTKALLDDGPADKSTQPPASPKTRRRTSALNSSVSSATAVDRRSLRSGSAQPRELGMSRQGSPVTAQSREASPARKRVVRLSSASQSVNQIQPSKRRSTSTSRTNPRARPQSWQEPRDSLVEQKQPPPPLPPQSDVNTPAQAGRVVRIVTGSSGRRNRAGLSAMSSDRSNIERSASDKSGPDSEEGQLEGPDTVARNAPVASLGAMSRFPSTASKPKTEEIHNLHGSMRIKRVGKTPGSFLSGPARRGRRRQSEEDGEDNPDGEIGSHDREAGDQPMEEGHPMSFYNDGVRGFNSGSPISGNAAARASYRKQASGVDFRGGNDSNPVEAASYHEPPNVQPLPGHNGVAKPELPSAHDQENEIPASILRAKPLGDSILHKVPFKPLITEVPQPKAASPDRKPLALVARNTPHRAVPPPPPKMSVLEAATATAGAATATQNKSRRNIFKVNGKCYTRVDCLGRGGSAKVYRVTAENGKMFALKRVSLENADELTVRGFRGEIDLLQKLSGIDRVIQLFDCEMNEEKQMLSLLMEVGELDMYTLMRSRQNPESARFDSVFVRFYWKEMLECLQSVHESDIVHSDLKPANFVLVQGRLKLIDFGIANAIQTDETVNVHREAQVGTPNYMSPESLMDWNNPRGGGRFAGRPKLMKLGKPSDVWSLGCILYQMVYGLPPFGHIANQMARCQAITSWDHQIEFPSRAVGGVLVPPSLIRTMKRCLIRDQHMRPTCAELLHETDPFLYPAELSEKTIPIDEEILARIIQSVVARCRERTPTEAESMSVWPQAYWASVKKAMASRT